MAASNIRYDDFVSNVQPDPAKPESTIMLSGFVGHGPEGHARVYPDPTLGTWYDIPEGDVVHSMPIPDSRLGGSFIWVRANSEIKPGSAAPAASETEAVQPQQAAAVGMNPTPRTHCHVCDPPMAAAAMQPTPTVQTHCFICPPHTQAVHCWTAPVVCDIMQMPTPATRCFICPPVHQTLATVCTQHCTQPNGGCTPLTVPPWVCGQPGGGFTPATVCTHAVHCPTQPVVCNLQPTQPMVCGVRPFTVGCQQGGGQQQLEGVPAAPAHPNTAATLCTQPPACPPRTVHNSQCICPTPSAVHQCGGPVHPTLATLCTLPPGCPPHTIHNSQCICPTPSAVHQCGGQTFTPTIPQHTVVGMCLTFGLCPSMACTPMTPIQNGVFTPFGR